jgi:hypothetical protein
MVQFVFIDNKRDNWIYNWAITLLHSCTDDSLRIVETLWRVETDDIIICKSVGS